jgi:large subunit ribosomal protein L13
MSDKTYMPRKEEIERQWFVVDAKDEILGRLATEIARILRGKHKPRYTPHADMGDHVIVINADKIRVTGRKADQKLYYRHTGYAGGIRSTSYREIMEKHPERILRKAIWGMLPHNSLGRLMFKKLRVYAGDEHPHQAQKPAALKF